MKEAKAERANGEEGGEEEPEGEEGDSPSSSSSDDGEDDESNEEKNASHDNLDEKLISFKSPNLMNQMLPHAVTAAAVAVVVVPPVPKEKVEKRKAEGSIDDQGPKKRVNTKGFGEFQKEQKLQEQMKELGEKYLTKSTIQFKDLGGMNEVIKQLREMIEWPLKYKNIFGYLGVKPPRGILISGPPGTGKTQLAMAICGEYPDIPFYKLNGPEIVSRLSG